ncbi:spondin domain-containing protein [Endozoicomonas arenosclerae]|uniref:spondin domain-containing protein n=1 Tax=Endozoicomonas arenosclerae TaxID=1633495 RepID=UPI0007832179|nr:spondin domain-containing protein [Endozoicomonas arenosclerae]
MNKVLCSLVTAGALSLGSTSAFSAEYDITVVNLTRGIHFTPLLVAAHNESTSLFSAGSTASSNLQAMAEGGDISGLATDLNSVSATVVENPASGLLAPGASTSFQLNTGQSTTSTRLSVVSMMLPTNDGFIGLSSATLPTTVGQRMVFNVNAYDAGTEANNELRGSGAPGQAGFPTPGPVASGTYAAGTGGTGFSATAEGFVHIHRGVLGDTNSTGGVSDISSTVHRWLNPVARVIVTLRAN